MHIIEEDRRFESVFLDPAGPNSIAQDPIQIIKRNSRNIYIYILTISNIFFITGFVSKNSYLVAQ